MNRTGHRSILAREREYTAIEMRKTGMSYKKIADVLQVTPVAVGKMVRKVLAQSALLTHAGAEDIRTLELERLDGLFAAHWPWATGEVTQANPKGLIDDKSANICLRVMQRRSELLGLDAPKVVEVKDETDIDAKLDRLIQGLKSRREIPVTVEVDCEAQPVDTPRGLVQLAQSSGTRVGQDQDRC